MKTSARSELSFRNWEQRRWVARRSLAYYKRTANRQDRANARREIAFEVAAAV